MMKLHFAAARVRNSPIHFIRETDDGLIGRWGGLHAKGKRWI